jgi:hypothetical protein
VRRRAGAAAVHATSPPSGSEEAPRWPTFTSRSNSLRKVIRQGSFEARLRSYGQQEQGGAAR